MKRFMGIVGLPTVFIATGWILLWTLWPSSARTGSAVTGREFSPRVSYAQSDVAGEQTLYLTPTRFARASWPGFGSDLDEADELRDLVPGTYASQPHLLKRTDGDGGNGKRRSFQLMQDISKQAENDYLPCWTDLPVFSQTAGSERRLRIELSSQLREFGFAAPDLQIDLLGDNGVSGEVAAYVEFDAEGVPEHVVIERGTGDVELNSRIVRAIYTGRLAKPGSACEGRVTVSFDAGTVSAVQFQNGEAEVE